ncbi:hypothetical protein XF30_10880, partial [Bradyrhizobium sp. SUTN9-2]
TRAAPAVALSTDGDLEHAGLGTFRVEDPPHIETLEQGTPGDIVNQLLNGDAGLHAPDFRLAEHQT